MFGDTFEEARVGGGWWRSPVGLYSTTALPDAGVAWSGAVGGEHAQQLWAYAHDNPVFTTVLPSDVILVGGTLFLYVSVHRGWGNVLWSEIWRSDGAAGATWRHAGARFPGNAHGGLFQLLTWALGEDGYVYAYSTGYGRNGPVLLHRVRAQDLAEPAALRSCTEPSSRPVTVQSWWADLWPARARGGRAAGVEARSGRPVAEGCGAVTVGAELPQLVVQSVAGPGAQSFDAVVEAGLGGLVPEHAGRVRGRLPSQQGGAQAAQGRAGQQSGCRPPPASAGRPPGP